MLSYLEFKNRLLPKGCFSIHQARTFFPSYDRNNFSRCVLCALSHRFEACACGTICDAVGKIGCYFGVVVSAHKLFEILSCGECHCRVVDSVGNQGETHTFQHFIGFHLRAFRQTHEIFHLRLFEEFFERQSVSLGVNSH